VPVLVFSGLAMTDRIGQDPEILLQKSLANLAENLKINAGVSP
jgi:hypothetical protein